MTQYPNNNPYEQQYQQQYPTQAETPVSIGDWILTYLIMCIPCLGLIMMFVWAFGNNTKKSKSNFCKAMLIVSAVCIVLSIIVFFIAGLGAIVAGS